MSSRLKDKEKELTKKLTNNILKYNLIEDKDTVLIGLSAGPDSVFLTLMLYKQQEILSKKNISFNIQAAHVNHKIRKEANFDQDLAKKICEKLNIPIYIKEIDVLKIANERKIGTEECGRDIRYEFFNEICDKNNISKIAIAHNMEDNAETIIMNFLRGAGIDGLKGIEYINKNIIRPILNISKQDILTYLDNNNIEYAIDKTNLNKDYTRNKIRNELLHKLKEYNPNIIQTLNNMSEILKDEDKLIEEVISKKINDLIKIRSDENMLIDIKIFNNLEVYEKKLLIKKVLETGLNEKKGITYDHIVNIIKLLDEKKTGKVFEIKDKYKIEILNKDTAILKKCVK